MEIVKTRLLPFSDQLPTSRRTNPDLSLKKLLIAVFTLAKNIAENQVKQQVTKPRQVFYVEKNLDLAPIVFFRLPSLVF